MTKVLSLRACIHSLRDMTRIFATRCVAHYSYDYRNARRKRNRLSFCRMFLRGRRHSRFLHEKRAGGTWTEIVLFLRRARSLCRWSFTGPPLLVRAARSSEQRRRRGWRRVGGGVFHVTAALVYHVTRWWDGGLRQRPLQSSNKRSELYALSLCMTRRASIRRGVSRLWKPMKSELSRLNDRIIPIALKGYLGVCVWKTRFLRQDIIIFYSYFFETHICNFYRPDFVRDLHEIS